MLGTRFDPQLFFQRADNAALNVAAGEVFGLLKRTLDLPAAWCALVTRETGDHVVTAAGAIVDGSDAQEVFFVRTSPIEIVLREEGLSTKEGHLCEIDVRLRIRVVPETTELVSFKKLVLGSRRVVQSEGLARFLQPAVRSAVAKHVAESDLSSLCDASAETVAAALLQALAAPCFSAGLVIEGAPIVRFESKSLRDVRRTRENAAMRLAEHEAHSDLRRAIQHAQSDHLGHLTNLLSRLRELTVAQPGVALADLIRTFAPTQRGELYDALLSVQSPGARTRWIVAAVGDELLFFDPSNPAEATRRVAVAGEAGPVRSVQWVDESKVAPVFWLGAASGVYRLACEGGSVDGAWLAPAPASIRGGFNSVAVADGKVFASHSELGIWEWSIDGPTSARPRFLSMTRSAGAVRHVQRHDADLYCAIDDRVIRWSASDAQDQPTAIFTGASSTLTALRMTSHGLLAGTSEGDILLWSENRHEEPQRLHHGPNRPAESVGLMQSHGVTRFFFADSTSRAQAFVLGESVTWRFEAGGQIIRRVISAPDLLVGVNELRDKLFLWNPAGPGAPDATIPIGKLFGRTVQDVALVPRSSVPSSV